ncbi:MAG: hypothetical protein SPH34_07430, partial [Lachnospiraceae bacterium]|uniref:hypothetical protein n=1 Tax=Galactobacillus timonensis TaxID=2041840 RepID=UPI0023F3C54E
YFYSEVHKAEMQAKSDDRERNYALFIASVRLISTCLLKWNLTFHLSLSDQIFSHSSIKGWQLRQPWYFYRSL